MPGRYIFLKSSSLDHYKAVFAAHCFDDRFRPATEKFLASLGNPHYDIVSVAGGAKIFSSPEKESDRDFMLRELEKSIVLHHTSRVMLFTHYDCGAYGGLAHFAGDEEKQFAFHEDELRKAAAAVREKFSGLAIETYFIDKEGIVQVK